MKRHTPFNAKDRPVKKDEDYRTPKKAFDEVMNHYTPEMHVDLFGTMQTRSESRLRIDVERFKRISFYEEVPKRDPSKKRGQGTVAPKGTPVKNPTAPTLIDFHIDVDRQVKKVIKNKKHMAKFILRGMEKLSKEEQHLFSRYEQQIGRLFMRTKIWPLSKYFVSIREKQ